MHQEQKEGNMCIPCSIMVSEAARRGGAIASPVLATWRRVGSGPHCPKHWEVGAKDDTIATLFRCTFAASKGHAQALFGVKTV